MNTIISGRTEETLAEMYRRHDLNIDIPETEAWSVEPPPLPEIIEPEPEPGSVDFLPVLIEKKNRADMRNKK